MCGSQKFDAKLLKMLPEYLPELPAIANVVIVIVAVVPRQPLATLLVLNQTPMGSKRKKRKSTHQWPSVAEHHLVHTIRTQDESIQKKTSHMFGTHKNVPARAQTLPPERSEARVYEPKWHFASHPARVVFFSGKRRRQLGGNKCRLSVTQVWRGTEELASFSRSASCRSKCFDGQSSQRAASRFYRFLGTRLRAEIWEECLLSTQ